MLAQLVHEAQLKGAPFEVVIDDGGHENKLMLPAFHSLWPSVTPGGLYFIEDMQTCAPAYAAPHMTWT